MFQPNASAGTSRFRSRRGRIISAVAPWFSNASRCVAPVAAMPSVATRGTDNTACVMLLTTPSRPSRRNTPCTVCRISSWLVKRILTDTPSMAPKSANDHVTTEFVGIVW